MSLYELVVRPLLFGVAAEQAHDGALRVLAGIARCVPPRLLGAAGRWWSGGRLPVEVAGLSFPNPVGLAAGMDKNGVALPAWEAMGFGFVEVGTVTALAQPGNPKPRLFRIPGREALLNRMGFNNEGCEAVARRLEAWQEGRRWPMMVVGINIGKSKAARLEEAPEDYLKSYRRLYALGDFFTVNVSSPNTPGLRALQAGEELRRIVETLRGWEGGARKPLFVKLAPDLGDAELVAAAVAAESAGADGIVATNTTLERWGLPEEFAKESGGVSGWPLRERARRALAVLRGATKLPLVASGGIVSGAEAAARRRMGAALVELYTGLVYRGPGLVRECVEALREAGA